MNPRVEAEFSWSVPLLDREKLARWSTVQSGCSLGSGATHVLELTQKIPTTYRTVPLDSNQSMPFLSSCLVHCTARSAPKNSHLILHQLWISLKTHVWSLPRKLERWGLMVENRTLDSRELGILVELPPLQVFAEPLEIRHGSVRFRTSGGCKSRSPLHG